MRFQKQLVAKERRIQDVLQEANEIQAEIPKLETKIKQLKQELQKEQGNRQEILRKDVTHLLPFLFFFEKSTKKIKNLLFFNWNNVFFVEITVMLNHTCWKRHLLIILQQTPHFFYSENPKWHPGGRI